MTVVFALAAAFAAPGCAVLAVGGIINFSSRNVALALFLTLTPSASTWADELWPDLAKPAPSVGGGEQDAGVVVGIDAYSYVPPVLGAEPNAKAWYDYLTRTRGAAPGNIKLLLGVDATRDDMLDAAQAAAAKVGPKGTLWFVFVGHGAPSSDGKDGLLVGVDAQQKAASLQKRSLRRQELLAALAKSRADSISVILDACFSGRGPDGASIAPGLQPLVTVASPVALDPRIVVLTAARGDQFAGSLPGANRPAFSYLALGALRGWAGGPDGRVTAGAIWHYATSALDATLRGRNQTPDLMGKEAALVGASPGEKGPDLAALAKATAGGGTPDVEAAGLPAIPRAPASKAPKARVKAHSRAVSGNGGIKWVAIPAGSFMMGANTYGNLPIHQVTINAFDMAKTEVTNKQYRACVDAGVCTIPSAWPDKFEKEDQPVIEVTWEQARTFSEWVGGRLPSEAEWEYAARSAGKDIKYPWGNEAANCERAVISDASGSGCGRNSTWPVCSKVAGNTAQGLCDMSGNVIEWTQDLHHRTSVDGIQTYGGAPTDGSAWESSVNAPTGPTGYYRVYRGGHWSSNPGDVVAAGHGGQLPDFHHETIGFRPVR